MRLSRYQAKINEVSQRIRQRQYLGRNPTARATYGLALMLRMFDAAKVVLLQAHLIPFAP